MINDTSSMNNTSSLTSEFHRTITKKRKIIVLGGPGVGNIFLVHILMCLIFDLKENRQ